MSQKPKKVPVILQMEAMDCSATSLCMVLAYYKKWLSLDQVREECGVSRDGSNALNIWKAAEKYGLATKANRYDVEQLQTEATFPAIIWWNNNHFMVLDGFDDGKAVVNDPARGRVEIPLDEFAESYSSLCLQFEPTEAFRPEGRPADIQGFLSDKIKGNEAEVLLVLLTGVLAVALGALMPVFFRVFADKVLEAPNPIWLGRVLMLFGGLIVLRAIASGLNAQAILRVTGKLAVTSNTRFMWHILRLPVDFFTRRPVGNLTGKQRANDTVADTLIRVLAPHAINVALVIIYLFVMMRYSVPLTLVGVGASLLNLFIAVLISKNRKKTSAAKVRDQAMMDVALISGIDMIETIKSTATENGFFETWSGYHASVVCAKTEFAEFNRYLDPLTDLLKNLSSMAVLLLGVWLIMKGRITAGMLLAFQSYLDSFLKPVRQIIATDESLQQMPAAMQHIEDVMKYPADVPETVDPHAADGLGDAQKLSGEVTMEHVTFGYVKVSEPVITDFSLSLKQGSRVAVVGASGAGKSTIAKLLSGLYQPWEGEIKYDGKRISEIMRPVFVGSVAMVDQDAVLFEDTIRNNIVMWDSTIGDSEIIRAAKDAGIHEYIHRRKGSYQHVLREDGSDLSEGQRQRLEIARALASEPTIVIMDEATSALDAQAECEIMKALRSRNITSVIMSQRLSTIQDCDEIIVLDKGSVVERGRHEDLIKNDGLYRKLVLGE